MLRRLLLSLTAFACASLTHDIDLPIDVHVGLLGFSGDGAFAFELDAAELQQLLSTLLPSRRPSCGPEGERLDVLYRPKYTVVRMQTGLPQLQKTLAAAMRPVATAGADGAPRYEVEAREVEEHFALLHASYFASAEQPQHPGVSVLVVNPDRDAMAAAAGLPARYSYRYRYAGGAPTQMWLGGGRFLVLDLSAGPCRLGGAEAGAGAVSAASVPQLHAALQGGADARARRAGAPEAAAAHKMYHTQLLAQLASLVLSGVRLLAAPDVHACDLSDFSKLRVEIVVLRNHDEFDPLEQGHAYSLDVGAVRAELNRLLLPDQELILSAATHALHDHPELAVALAHARQSDSVLEAADDGSSGHVLRSRPYLDSTLLHHDLARLVDWGKGGLASVATRDHGPAAPWAATADEDDIFLHGVQRPPVGSQGGGGGTRVLPVYVFSLVGHHEALLLDKRSLVHADGRQVVVLQTDAPSLPLPYFSEAGGVKADPGAPTRHVVAGVAHALGGVADPLASFDGDGALVSDFLWAAGAHPFGPFAAAAALSQVHVDVSHRHAIVAILHSSLRALLAAAASVEALAARFAHAPGGDSPEHRADLARVRDAALAAAHSGAAPHGNLTPHQAQSRLLERLRRGAAELSSDLAQREVLRHYAALLATQPPLAVAVEALQAGRLRPAHEAARAFAVHAAAAARGVEIEIAELDAQLRCCEATHAVAGDHQLPQLAAVLIASAALYAAFSWGLSSPRAGAKAD